MRHAQNIHIHEDLTISLAFILTKAFTKRRVLKHRASCTCSLIKGKDSCDCSLVRESIFININNYSEYIVHSPTTAPFIKLGEV